MEMQHKLMVDMLITVKDGHERVCIKIGAISEFSCEQVLWFSHPTTAETKKKHKHFGGESDIMSNVLGCRSTMAAMGGRVAVLGSRGLLQWQRQCSVAAVGAMGSILQLAIQRRLPNLQWPKEAPYFSRLLQESHQRLSLFPLQCALQDASLPSTKLLLFNSNGTFVQSHFSTKDCCGWCTLIPFNACGTLQIHN